MAKAFSEKEKTHIVKRLKDMAEKCLKEGSIRKVSVDELAKEAGISKGAFYIFYRSKEELFFDVINDYHERMEAFLTARLSIPGPKGSPELIKILVGAFHETASSFLPKLLAGRDLELLIRKLPPDVIAGHHSGDAAFFERICSLVPSLEKTDYARYSAAFRGIFLLLLHKNEIGESFFDGVLELLVSGVVRDMFGEVHA